MSSNISYIPKELGEVIFELRGIYYRHDKVGVDRSNTAYRDESRVYEKIREYPELDMNIRKIKDLKELTGLEKETQIHIASQVKKLSSWVVEEFRDEGYGPCIGSICDQIDKMIYEKFERAANSEYQLNRGSFKAAG